MLRRILAVLGPSATILLLIVILRPVDLGYLSFLLVTGTVMLGAAGAFLIHPDPEEPPEPETSGWLVVLALMSAAATAVFWFRVWQYDRWDLVTIPVKLLYVIGFWWPGAFLAALAWVFAGPYVFRTLRRYGIVLAVGVVASTVGAASYQVVYSSYYKAHDGQSLQYSMERLASKTPGRMSWQHNRAVLTVLADFDWASSAPPYTVFSSLSAMAEQVVRQLYRADVSAVNLQVSAQGLLLFSGNASDEAPGDPADWIKRMDRTVLKNGGHIEQGSLDEMAELAPGEFPAAEDQEAFRRTFQCGASANEISIVFTPDGPVSLDNIGQYVAAYRIANRIVAETVIYFPEIESFRVDLAGRERLVQSKNVAPRAFFLQADLLPADRVLGLVVRDQGLGSGILEPATFRPGVPLDENQLAAVVVSKNVTNEICGRLFQPILVAATNVVLTEVGEDGTAKVFVLPQGADEVPAGPVTIAPGVEEVAAGQWILNSGLLERTAFGPDANPPSP